ANNPPIVLAELVPGNRRGVDELTYARNAMAHAKDQAERQYKAPCQLILCPKATQDSKDYGEIKVASDTNLGVPSQVNRGQDHV
ncbi:unnamed protein product, partial [Discosporangium mesarthrocarpum]